MPQKIHLGIQLSIATITEITIIAQRMLQGKRPPRGTGQIRGLESFHTPNWQQLRHEITPRSWARVERRTRWQSKGLISGWNPREELGYRELKNQSIPEVSIDRGDINTIASGFTGDNHTSLTRKRHLRSVNLINLLPSRFLLHILFNNEDRPFGTLSRIPW